MSNDVLVERLHRAAERAKWNGNLDHSKAIYDAIAALEASPVERQHTNLLCIIHRDGGQYLDTHGREQAHADAMQLSSERIVAVEQMREALIDWRNCWCCPATAFDGEVDRLIAQTDAALQLTGK